MTKQKKVGGVPLSKAIKVVTLEQASRVNAKAIQVVQLEDKRPRGVPLSKAIKVVDLKAQDLKEQAPPPVHGHSPVQVRSQPKEHGPICPRCGGYIPCNATPGAYPGALSRADDETEVWSECGDQEVYESGTTKQKKANWVRPDVARSAITGASTAN